MSFSLENLIELRLWVYEYKVDWAVLKNICVPEIQQFSIFSIGFI